MGNCWSKLFGPKHKLSTPILDSIEPGIHPEQSLIESSPDYLSTVDISSPGKPTQAADV